MLIERWRDRSDQESYLVWRRETGAFGEFLDTLRGRSATPFDDDAPPVSMTYLEPRLER